MQDCIQKAATIAYDFFVKDVSCASRHSISTPQMLSLHEGWVSQILGGTAVASNITCCPAMVKGIKIQNSNMKGDRAGIVSQEKPRMNFQNYGKVLLEDQ